MEHKKQQKIENVFLFLQNAILQNLFSPFFVYFLRRLLALIIAGMHRAAKIRIQNSKIKIERNGEKKTNRLKDNVTCTEKELCCVFISYVWCVSVYIVEGNLENSAQIQTRIYFTIFY